jgi:ketosteroid isomerase-like protein
MSEEENTRLVQQAYRDFQNGHIQGVLGSLSEDVEWLTPQLSGVPVGGTYHGVEEAGRFFSSLDDAQEPRLFEPREFVAQGEKVVALGHYAWHVRSTGRQWESDFAHVFSVRDGKIARFQEYTDTAAIADAFRGG